MTPHLEIEYVLHRREWWSAQGIGIVVWSVLGLLTLAPVLMLAMYSSPGWLLLLAPWWMFPGRRVTSFAAYLVRGEQHRRLELRADRTLALSCDGGPVFVYQLHSLEPTKGGWMLWGADARYEIFIPTRALGARELEVLQRWSDGENLVRST